MDWYQQLDLQSVILRFWHPETSLIKPDWLNVTHKYVKHARAYLDPRKPTFLGDFPQFLDMMPLYKSLSSG